MKILDWVVRCALRHEMPAEAREFARLSLLDWMACGMAGASEPVAIALRKVLSAEGGHPVAAVFGGRALPARAAALANGTASHALDYDDTHFAHVGHLSVAIYPAALAAGEEVGATTAEVIDAFVAGAEAAIRIGLHLGRGHYDRGFHQTATSGAFGATVAAGRLLRLSEGEMRAAIGLCSTRASGLKNQFGTMGKPLNAGFAAANGIECARLARAGLTSADDGIDGPQGFIATHADAPSPAVGDEARFLLPDLRFKLHACCHGTHAMIDALRPLAGREVREVKVRTHPRWLSVCDVRAPRTGLEVKFSYVWLAAMVLRGVPTASVAIYTDALAADPDLAAVATRVRVAGDPALEDTQAALEAVLADGERVALNHDLAAPLATAALASGLRAKAEALVGGRLGVFWDDLAALPGRPARDIGACIGAR